MQVASTSDDHSTLTAPLMFWSEIRNAYKQGTAETQKRHSAEVALREGI